MKKSYPVLVLSLLLAAMFPLCAQSLDSSRIGPGDRPEAILTMPGPARVSIWAASPLGAAFSLHDRLEGSIYRGGIPGQADGRIDASLDKGEYKLRFDNIAAAGGLVELTVKTFAERNGADASAWPRLVGGRVRSGSLRDLESASYWVELRQDGPLEVEALGRDLALMEVWREGQYIVGSWKPREEVQVETGRPMGWICASKALKAGSYLVRLYGGRAREWAKDDGNHPLHVRSGFLRLPMGGRMDLKVSPFGRDFILMDGMKGGIVSRDDKIDTKVASASYAPGKDRLSTNYSASINSKSKAPWCALDLPRGLSLLTVKAAPGDSLRVDAWANASNGGYESLQPGTGGLLTLISPRTGDADLEPTGLVFHWLTSSYSGVRKAEILRDFTAPLSGRDSLRRRANFVQANSLTMYIRVDEAGSYRIAEKTGIGQAKAFYSLSPLDSSLSSGRSAYEAGPDKASVSLTTGYHLLRIQAKELGVLDFVIYRDGLGQTGRDDLAAEPPQTRRNFAWVLSPGETGTGISIMTGQRGTAPTGSEFRPFPLDAPGGIDLDLGPGEEVQIPLATAAASRIAELSPGSSLGLGGGKLSSGSRLGPGRGLALSLGNQGQAVLRASFRLEEDLSDLGLPRVTAFGSGLAALSAGQTLWRDFQRGESLSAAFEVKTGSVYALESLGRLSTSLVLRSAAREKIKEAKANGYGRNAAIRTYLGPGQYYLELKAEGRSAGRAGLSVTAVPETARLDLAPARVDRRWVAADSMLRYAFMVEKEASFRLSSIGLGSSYAIRVEDGDGFPLYSGPGEASLALAPGPYSLFSLPVSIETRRVTTMELIPPKEGILHGPGLRRIALNSQIQAFWTEGPEADSYAFSLPSDLGAVILVPAGFAASLAGPTGPASAAGSASAAGPQDKQDLAEGENSLELKTGDYTLSLRPKEKANELAYSLGLYTTVLAPGLVFSQALETGEKAELAISLPRDGFYEFWSQGQNDLAAELVSSSGRVVASCDDNGADWNILFSQALPAGRYTLRLRSLAGGGRTSDFHLEERKPRTAAALAAGAAASLDLDRDGVVVPLDKSLAEGLYLIETQGSWADLRLYRGDELLASAEGRIVIPLGQGGAFSLYATSPSPIKAGLSLTRLAQKKVASLSGALDLGPGEAIKMTNPEALSARVTEGRILLSPGINRPCGDPGEAAFSVYPEGGWLWAYDSKARVEPLALAAQDTGVLTLSGELAGLDHGASLAAGKGEVLLLKTDTRGAFRSGISALAGGQAGAAPRDWSASQAWAGGSLALLPPGPWKARIWDGEASPDATRKLGYELLSFRLESRPSLAMGDRRSFSIPAGKAWAMDVPASRAELILGEGLVVAAWKDGRPQGGCNSLDARLAKGLDLPASTLLVLNTAKAEAAFRIDLLPSQAPVTVEAAKAWEAQAIGPEGMEIQVRARDKDLLCIAGAPGRMELSGSDGSFRSIEASGGPITSLAAVSGRLDLGASQGLVRVWLARPGEEAAGLSEDGEAPGTVQGLPELKDILSLPGRAGAYRLSLAAPGFVDLSAPGPGLLSINSKTMETRLALGTEAKDVHLFAWLPAGDYRVWQRPARGASGLGSLRATKIEARAIASAEDRAGGLIGAKEFQAWSFQVKEGGLVGLGLRAEKDGLGLLLYDAKQGLISSGRLILDELPAGDYLAVVEGLAEEPAEYSLFLEGAFGSREGVPQDIIDAYRKAGGRPSAAIGVPLHGMGARLEAPADESYVQDEDSGNYEEDGEYPSEGK